MVVSSLFLYVCECECVSVMYVGDGNCICACVCVTKLGALLHSNTFVAVFIAVVHLLDGDLVRALDVFDLHDDAQVLHDPRVRAHLRASNELAAVGGNRPRFHRTLAR